MISAANLAWMWREVNARIGTHYTWGGTLDPDDPSKGTDCLVAGTLVTTARGDVPIEQVTHQDWVLTRHGYRRVLRAWKVRDDAPTVELTVHGRVLRGTADHRVWTENRGWVALGMVTGTDTLVLCQELNESYSKDSSFDVTPIQKSHLPAPTFSVSQRSKVARHRYTGPSGRTTMAPSLTGTKFTTSTMTRSTMTSPILCASNAANTVAKARRNEDSTITHVPSAVSGFRHIGLARVSDGSVAENTRTATGLAQPGPKSPVYDVSVDGVHEFFANGVLVHNCSGAVGFVIEALLDGPDMNWDRPFWTGTFAGMRPGQVAQPWGLVCIARPSDAPADAAAIVAINQGPSADTSHMIVRVLDRSLDPEGIDIEDAGNGFQKYDKAASITDAQFNQWFYLPGPLEQPAPTGLTAETLSQAMGSSLPITRYAELLRPVRACLIACGCTTLNRSAMWMAQVGHESGGLKYMEEIADGSAYEGRDDLGNTQPGDGRKFKGRGPIQVTGRHNYAALSAWAFGRRLVPTVTFFTDEPEQLASDTYGFVGVIWYWTVARDMNSYADARDIVGATRAVNGGTNGLDDRTARWNRCLAMGFDALSVSAAIPDTGGFLMALTDAEQHELLDLVRQEAKYPRDSRSPLRRLGEHNVDTILGLEWNTDANVHVLVMEALAALGHPPTLALLSDIAGADPQRWPDRQEDRKLAQAILTKIQMPAGTTTVIQQASPVVPQQVSPPVAPPANLQTQTSTAPGGSLGDDFSLLHTQLRSLTDALAELSSAFLGKK